MVLLETKYLGKSYLTSAEEIQALRGVDLRIAAGDFLVINGPSGSGKTTLLNLLAGIDKPTHGKVYLEQQALNKLSDSKRTILRRDKIGLIFQSFELIPVLTAGENVEYPLLLQKVAYKERQERVKEVLASVGLGEEINRLPSQLSGGQKQRVAIARALVTRPAVILADEPTGNLDSDTGLKIIKLLLGLNERYGVAVVIVTHDLSINKYANRVCLLKDGLLTEEGGKEDV